MRCLKRLLGYIRPSSEVLRKSMYSEGVGRSVVLYEILLTRLPT
jgi:hypothetical protein